MEVWTGLGQEELAPEFKLTHHIINKRFLIIYTVAEVVRCMYYYGEMLYYHVDHQNIKFVPLDTEM